ncbi:ubiquitin-conjugating enzyme E2 Z-like protein, partial [Leptotrombidium deliense]
HALIIGPKYTPYEGGFFYFSITYPNEYPSRPLNVKLMTTGNDSISFNPNFALNGYVRLSILNTCEGPPWSPALTVSTVLISIQSLMNKQPYYNEPGYENIKEAD